MEIIQFTAVNLLLFLSYYLLLFKTKSSITFIDRILGTFVLCLNQIIITELILGVLFKKLFSSPLFFLNISISLIILFLSVALKKPLVPEGSGLKPQFKGFLLFGLLNDAFIELKDRTGHFIKLLKQDLILMTVFILFSVYLFFLIFKVYLFPAYAWDALFYHIPTVGFILQSGSIEMIPYNSLIYTFINVFPKNIDLFFLWNVIFLKSDVIVDLGQLFFTLAGMLAIYSIAIKIDIKEKYAVYSSILFFFAPVVILQSTANYVDIAVSVMFLMAVNFVLYPRFLLESSSGGTDNIYDDVKRDSAMTGENHEIPSGRNIKLLLAGITAGLLLGSKGSGPLFIAALSMLYFINEFRASYSLRRKGVSAEAKRKSGIKNSIARYAVLFLLPVILLGSYWYIQNWIYYGNPVYPFIVKLFGKTVFPGVLSKLLHSGPAFLEEMPPLKRLFHVWLEKTGNYSYASDLSGFGPLWFIVLLPSTVFSVLISLWKKRFDFLLIAGMIIIIVAVYPNNWFTRYTIFMLGLGCLAFGMICQFFHNRSKILTYSALFIVSYTFLTANSPTVTPGKIREFMNLPAKERNLARLEPFILNVTQKENYNLWAWISKYVSDSDTLAYNFTPSMLGPLWNSSISNKIVFIKAGKFEEWMDKLEKNNATLVLVLLKPRSMEYVWLSRLREMRNNPKWSAIAKKFRLEYYDDNYAMFRFIR